MTAPALRRLLGSVMLSGPDLSQASLVETLYKNRCQAPGICLPEGGALSVHAPPLAHSLWVGEVW